MGSSSSNGRELWGVKWGAYDDSLVKCGMGFAVYEFTTAWAPPEKWLIAVSKIYPALCFALSFAEESPSRGRLFLRSGVVAGRDKESFLHPSYPRGECSCDLSEVHCNYCKANDEWENQKKTHHDEWVLSELQGPNVNE